MEKLLQKYKEECDIIPTTASRIWKIGTLVIMILYITISICTGRFIEYSIITIILIILIYLVCHLINAKKIKKILKITSKCKVKDIYIEIDKIQKKWIVDYCRKNKLNRIEKINIIRNELRNKNERPSIKYLDPIIIAALCLSVWEIIVQCFNNTFGLFNTIVISAVAILIITIGIGWLKKEWKEQMKFLNEFEGMRGYKRLDELLLYVALKCSK